MSQKNQRLFEPAEKLSPRGKRISAAYEIAYTLTEFSAAATFIIGSVMFFSAAWETTGTWFFLIGSILFALKPTIRLFKELALVAEGKADQIGN